MGGNGRAVTPPPGLRSTRQSAADHAGAGLHDVQAHAGAFVGGVGPGKPTPSSLTLNTIPSAPSSVQCG